MKKELSDKAVKTLSQDDLLVVLSYAPAGLGHLRVADALKDGLPDEVEPVLFGSHDRAIEAVHRFVSIHPITRAIMEVTQRGKMQGLFTFFYRMSLRIPNRKLYEQMLMLLEQRVDEPKTLVVVATHFGLAHQLAVIKKRMMEKTKIELKLVVVVTDDSPQYIWYVPGADVIFVASHTTRKGLESYAEKYGLPKVRFEVVAYPVSLKWSAVLPTFKLMSKRFQVSLESTEPINVAMPVSGAAVGLKFYTDLVDELARVSERFVPHVVVKSAIQTQLFLNEMIKRPQVKLHVANSDRGVVDVYEKLLTTEEVVGFEVTKPSEQAFKALVEPDCCGGPLMLFARPVGRQEYDNLAFLRRHGLIPELTLEKRLWRLAEAGENLRETDSGREILASSKNWRGLRLPMGSKKAAEFIWWCLSAGIFAKMIRCRLEPKAVDRHKEELHASGVVSVWERVAELVEG